MLSNEQLDGLKAGLADLAQGALTLHRVISMIQIPETDKYPDGRPDKEED